MCVYGKPQYISTILSPCIVIVALCILVTAQESIVVDIPGSSVKFWSIGDFGEWTSCLAQNAAEMRRLVRHNITAPDFILAVGDNFYPRGVMNTSDPLWKTIFVDPFANTTELRGVPWYPCYGNHDLSNISAQIAYREHNWTFPSEYYSVSFTSSQCKASPFLELFVLNTNTLLFGDIHGYVDDPETSGIFYPNVTGEARHWMENVMTEAGKQQLRWLRNSLNDSRALVKMVVGHHPIFSGGVHGNHYELLVQLAPAFEQYGVDMYLSGHDHHLQYIVPPDASFHQLISGAGSFGSPAPRKHPGTVFHGWSHGFMETTVTCRGEISTKAFQPEDRHVSNVATKLSSSRETNTK